MLIMIHRCSTFIGGVLQITNANYNWGTKLGVSFTSGFRRFVSHCQNKYKHVETPCVKGARPINSTIVYLMWKASMPWIGGGHNHTNSLLLPSWQNTFWTFQPTKSKLTRFFPLLESSLYKCFQTKNLDKLMFINKN